MSGLRREEVALLASISTEYYTRIEQGRLQASAALLDEIARVLRLNEAQHIYLLELAARQKARPPSSGDRKKDPQLQRMLDDLTATPAFVIGRRTDILGWNQLAAWLWTDFGRYPEEERVFIRLLFTEPWMRELYADWEEVTRLAIAHLRMESARYPGEPRVAALVEELSARDAQFRQWWAEHDVAMRDKGTKKLRHPAVGEVDARLQHASSPAPPGPRGVRISPLDKRSPGWNSPLLPVPAKRAGSIKSTRAYAPQERPAEGRATRSGTPARSTTT